MLKIGNIELEMPFVQAPLSGYTDWPMRVIARRCGAPLTFTGVMLDQIAVNRKAMKKKLFQLGEEPRPVGAQILGSEPEEMAAAAVAFEGMGYDLIDLNFACPAPKVLRRERGGFLLADPNTVMAIFRAVRKAVRCPVTMKLRIGVTEDEASREDFRRICREAAAEGVDALTIHGRTVSQKYRGLADWEILAQVKRELPATTILGSGDLMDAETAVRRVRESGLDGAMIARGAVGNPWIFTELRALWEGREPGPGPSLAERGEVMLEHLEMMCRLKDEMKAVPYFRKFCKGFSRVHPRRKAVLMELISAKTKDELAGIIRREYGTLAVTIDGTREYGIS